MKLNLVKVLVILCVATTAGIAQVWDYLLFPDEALEEEHLFDEENDENSTSVLKLVNLNSADILNEKELLEESSSIIIDEVHELFDNELDETNDNHLNEIITEHTVKLFNVISQIKSAKDESSKEIKINFNDIFIWSNESDVKIKELLEEYYRDS